MSEYLYWIVEGDKRHESDIGSWDNPIPGPPYNTESEAEVAGREKWPGSSFRIYKSPREEGRESGPAIKWLDRQLAGLLLEFGGFLCSDDRDSSRSWVSRPQVLLESTWSWSVRPEALDIAGYHGTEEELKRRMEIPVSKAMIADVRQALLSIVRRHTPGKGSARSQARFVAVHKVPPKAMKYEIEWFLGEHGGRKHLVLESEDDASNLISVLRTAGISCQVHGIRGDERIELYLANLKPKHPKTEEEQ